MHRWRKRCGSRAIFLSDPQSERGRRAGDATGAGEGRTYRHIAAARSLISTTQSRTLAMARNLTRAAGHGKGAGALGATGWGPGGPGHPAIAPAGSAGLTNPLLIDVP